MAKKPEGGSYLLCLFSGDVYENFGASDDWSNIEKFEKAAVKYAANHLKLNKEYMDTDVIEYLDRVGGRMFRSPSNRVWYQDPSGWEKEWDRLSHDNACVYDFPATSSLFRYLIETAEVDFIDPANSDNLKKGIRNRFLESDSRILHQLILHEKIYLNITNLIKENVNFDILKDHGIATEYPRALSKEYLGVYIGLKPLIMEYIDKLLKNSGIIN